MDVKCEKIKNPATSCKVNETIGIQSGDDLNIIDVADPNKIKTVSISDPWRLNDFPIKIFQQFMRLINRL